MFYGISASEGIGIGQAAVVSNQPLFYTPKDNTDPTDEQKRLEKAATEFIAQTEALAERVEKNASAQEAEILRGHIAMLKDPFMWQQMEEEIANHQCAERAVEHVCDAFAAMLAQSESELIKQRAADLEDIKHRLLALLLGRQQTDLSDLPPESVLVTEELTPSLTASLPKERISAVVTETGGMTSHSAILSRALGIPAVLAVPDITAAVKNGQTMIVDGCKGEVLVSPDDRQLEQYTKLREEQQRQKAVLEPFISRPTRTKDGISLKVRRVEPRTPKIDNFPHPRAFFALIYASISSSNKHPIAQKIIYFRCKQF